MEEENGIVTKAKLRNVVRLSLDFLEGGGRDLLNYIDGNESMCKFPLDEKSGSFLEVIPRDPEDNWMSTVLRCVPGYDMGEEKDHLAYEELRNAILYTQFDDSRLGTLLVFRCGAHVSPKHKYIGKDKYGNMIQGRALGTDWISNPNGTRLLETMRTRRLIWGMRDLERILGKQT